MLKIKKVAVSTAVIAMALSFNSDAALPAQTQVKTQTNGAINAETLKKIIVENPDILKEALLKNPDIIREAILKNPSMVAEGLQALQKEFSEREKAFLEDMEKKITDKLPSVTAKMLDPKNALVFGNGPKKVVGFLDPVCPYCVKMVDTLKDLANDPNYTVILRYMSVIPIETDALINGLYGTYAQNKDKALVLLEKIKSKPDILNGDNLQKIYHEIGVDVKKIDSMQKEIKGMQDANKALAQEANIAATPIFFVGTGDKLEYVKNHTPEDLRKKLAEVK